MLHSLTNVLRPWDMESTEKNLYFYSEFLIFHIAVALTIGSTFLIPLVPFLMTPTVTAVFMIFMGLAFLIGLRRIYRRFTVPEIRIISSPDDYFAIMLMTVFFGVGFVTMWLWIQGSPETGWMWLFFLMTTFFLHLCAFQQDIPLRPLSFRPVQFRHDLRGAGDLEKGNPDVTWDPKV